MEGNLGDICIDRLTGLVNETYITKALELEGYKVVKIPDKETLSYKEEYQEVTYEVRFTNRSEYTVVVADGYGSAEENVITLKGETRKEINGLDIVLSPGESKTFTFTYTKFVDDGDSISDMTFGSIRVMEQYSGTDLNKVTEDQINQEINNAVDKFSMKLAL